MSVLQISSRPGFSEYATCIMQHTWVF